jgi:hypothetical protein
LGLNIREAHAFNTNDGFSLDVFVVDLTERQVTLGTAVQPYFCLLLYDDCSRRDSEMSYRLVDFFIVELKVEYTFEILMSI